VLAVIPAEAGIQIARGAIWSRSRAGDLCQNAYPTAAKLFAEWLTSPEGQAAIDAVGRASSRKGFKSKTSIENGWVPNIKALVVANKSYVEDAPKWLDTAVKPMRIRSSE